MDRKDALVKAVKETAKIPYNIASDFGKGFLSVYVIPTFGRMLGEPKKLCRPGSNQEVTDIIQFSGLLTSGVMSGLGYCFLAMNAGSMDFGKINEDFVNVMAINAGISILGNTSSLIYEKYHKLRENNEISLENKKGKLENKIGSEEKTMIGALKKEGYSDEIIYDTLKDPLFGLNQENLKQILGISHQTPNYLVV